MSNKHQIDIGRQEILIDQYKLYVEMADRISSRRGETNKFFITLLTALISLFSIVLEANQITETLRFGFITVTLLGMGLCVVWVVNIRSYRQLNSAKFKLISEIEKQLPFDFYNREWQMINSSNQYVRLTRIESYVPLLLGVMFLVQLIYVLRH